MRHGKPSKSRKGLVITLVVVLVAALGIAGTWFFFLRDNGDGGTTASTQTVIATRDPVIDPPVVAAPAQLQPVLADSGTKPDPAVLQQVMAPALSDPGLGTVRGEILDGATGEVLWSQGAGDPVEPASTLKLLLGTAVLTSMPPDTRFTTRIVTGPEPGDIIIIGGGDVTLSAAPTGVQSLYRNAPTVADLAAQVQASGYQVSRILVDNTYWSDDPLAIGWIEADITGTASSGQGFITRMEPLMVDADRLNPDTQNSRRTGEPSMNAARALARALGNPDLPIELGAQAAETDQQLAVVTSQPVSLLLAQALATSDNVLAEALGRQVAIARGAPPTFAGATDAVIIALEDQGIDTVGTRIYDVSGMSTENRVPTRMLAQVLQIATSGTVPALDNLLTGLAVAGAQDGTLRDRFNQPQNSFARGWVRAKTGSIGSTYGLAGYVTTVDGRNLVFALNSAGVSPATRPAQDTVAAMLRNCGCS